MTEFFGTILFVLALLIVRGRIPADGAVSAGTAHPADASNRRDLLVPGRARGVFVRDLAQINGYIRVVIWCFITPISCPEAQLNSLPAVAVAILRTPRHV